VVDTVDERASRHGTAPTTAEEPTINKNTALSLSPLVMRAFTRLRNNNCRVNVYKVMRSSRTVIGVWRTKAVTLRR